ncbi:MAG: hypothetical protein ACO1QB_10670, partial [Verrucomicrobiales bacterium]
SGGNGLLQDAFPGFGQQAYIGFHPPTNSSVFTTVFKPMTSTPVPANTKIVKFSVQMQIIASTKGSQDDFRWSFYNSDAKRLFSVDFETSTKFLSVLLETGDFEYIPFTFDHDGVYQLDIWLDFGRNLWTAFFNDVVILNSEPITTTGAKLDFGDMDAVWSIRDVANPGDNYLIFDDYTVSVENVSSIPSTLEVNGFNQAGAFVLRIHGEAGLNYSVETSTDMVNWESLGTFTAPPGGTFNFEDTTAKDFPSSFYRLKLVP